jgi:hypothetical protein
MPYRMMAPAESRFALLPSSGLLVPHDDAKDRNNDDPHDAQEPPKRPAARDAVGGGGGAGSQHGLVITQGYGRGVKFKLVTRS